MLIMASEAFLKVLKVKFVKHIPVEYNKFKVESFDKYVAHVTKLKFFWQLNNSISRQFL